MLPQGCGLGAVTGVVSQGMKMSRIRTRALMKAALLPAALLMAVGGSGVAFAGGAAATGHLSSGVSAPAPDSYYTMLLSSPSATVRAGHLTRTIVSFRATGDLYGTPVNLSVSGLPSGVTASFSPPATAIGGRSILTFTTAPSSPAGAFAVTVTAITIDPSDPIGTSATFGLTINAR